MNLSHLVLFNFFHGARYSDVPPPPTPSIPQGGAGRPVYWQGKRRKRGMHARPEAHLRQILDRVIAEYYGEIVDADVPQAVKKEAAAIVKPFADKAARFKSVPAVAQVDWDALQRDADAVEGILQIWSDEVRREQEYNDDEFMFFMNQ